MEIPNVYSSIVSLKHDPTLKSSSSYVILQPHQVIPKYYIFSDPSRHTLILNYSTGSGKSMTGLFTILERLYISKINDIYPKFFIPKATVVGEWMTQFQFRVDMSREMFNLIPPKLVQQLEQINSSDSSSNKSNKITKSSTNSNLANSVDSSQSFSSSQSSQSSTDEEDLINKIYRSMNRLVNFTGYQSLFNAIFPHYADRKIQDVDTLINDYKNNRLIVNEQQLQQFKNNIIVVDEMQKLYSQSGMNTYGFVLSYLSRMAPTLNLRIVYMSGTIYNSSLAETASILNLITERKEFYTVSELCSTSKVLDDMMLYKIKPAVISSIESELKNRYIYYSRGSATAAKVQLSLSEFKKLKPSSASDKSSSFVPPKYIYSDSVNLVVFGDNSKTLYPSELVLGNSEIDSNFCLFQIQASGIQLKTLASLSSSLESSDSSSNLDEDDSVLSPYDGALPPEEQWKKYDITRNSDGIYTGSFLLRKNLEQFSCVATKALDICLENAFNNEKTVMYHNRLLSFGLLQYGKILEYNGFVRRGYEPSPNSICRKCKETYKNHKSSCPRFTPIYFDFLHGLQRPNERQNIVNHVYNNPNNLYGELCSVLLISDVAYAGVSLMSTNNLIVLSRVSNISKLQQIMARIVRLKSHVTLEPSKRIAKFYILGATDKISSKSAIYKYYKLRSMSSEDVDKFLNTLKPKTIGELLLHHPDSLKLSKDEIRKTSELFFNDGQRVIENISHVVLSTLNFNWWRLDALISRIRSNKLAISYVDISVFPEEFIRKYIEEDKNLELFKFANVESNKNNKNNKSNKNDKSNKSNNKSESNKSNNSNNESNNNPTYVRQINSEHKYQVVSATRLNFDEIYADYTDTINDLKKQLETTNSAPKKRVFYIRLVELLELINDFSSILKWDYFWKYVFDIHDEYYDEDETNFIQNHSKTKRNPKNVKGFYWNDKIILRTGEMKGIKKTFVSSSWHPETKTVIHVIVSQGLHLLIFEARERKKEDDMRSIQRGIDCWSKKNVVLSKWYKLSIKNIVEFCSVLLEESCAEQCKNNKAKFILGPFEQDLNI